MQNEQSLSSKSKGFLNLEKITDQLCVHGLNSNVLGVYLGDARKAGST